MKDYTRMQGIELTEYVGALKDGTSRTAEEWTRIIEENLEMLKEREMLGSHYDGEAVQTEEVNNSLVAKIIYMLDEEGYVYPSLYRWYAGNAHGEIICEGDSKLEVELLLSDLGYDKVRLAEEEVEIFPGK